MTEAAAAVVERLRADGLPFLTATHDADNPKSGAVMERIGMTYRYSYEELWQPKNRLVIFRMYQMDLNGTWPLPGLLGPLAPPLGLKSALAICGKACYSCHRKVCTTECWGAGWNPAES